jgi:PAB-dependent poly(A)-specific ribonuclease subunit 3
MASLNQALPVHGQYNLYSEDHNTALGAANTFYPPQTAYSSDPQAVQPLHHHLYFPVGPHRDDLLPYQRLPHDFFTSEKLRQEATKKLEAVQQVIRKFNRLRYTYLAFWLFGFLS